MSWITFEDAGTSKSGKTLEWRVQPKETFEVAGVAVAAACIGMVKWYAPWRRYCLFPYSSAVFEWDCLRTIADFCEQKTREHKEKK